MEALVRRQFERKGGITCITGDQKELKTGGEEAKGGRSNERKLRGGVKEKEKGVEGEIWQAEKGREQGEKAYVVCKK